ncbi:MAG: hypothetical protein IBJ12_01715 [Sphingomonadaceae bacterium]|nr:hypothetical protein [Sphingomonadaceae bacterium]
MTFTRRQTMILLAFAALLLGFTLFQASWLADKPTGRPKLIADRAAEPVRDAAGCVASANSGYGGIAVSPDVGALQAAAGSGADAIRITTVIAGGALVVAPQFESKCATDQTRLHSTIADATRGLTRPELFWQINGETEVMQLVAALPTPAIDMPDRNIIIGDRAAVRYIKGLRPSHDAFSVAGARQCAADYRIAGIWGNVPEACRDGFMLLTLDDLGYTLWGWPNRFLARMKEAGVRLIIAQEVVDGQIRGLTEVDQYGDIANSYNGYIWVDDIEELGPALRRNGP